MERLADENDVASMLEEQDREARIAAARNSASSVRTGFCAWCTDSVPATALYCTAECREDHSKAIWASKQKGR